LLSISLTGVFMKILPFLVLLCLSSCDILTSPQAIAIEEEIVEEIAEVILEEILAHETQSK